MVDDNGRLINSSPGGGFSVEDISGVKEQPTLQSIAKQQGEELAKKQLQSQIAGVIEGSGGTNGGLENQGTGGGGGFLAGAGGNGGQPASTDATKGVDSNVTGAAPGATGYAIIFYNNMSGSSVTDVGTIYPSGRYAYNTNPT
jgi:hypothetical protein